ncbi:MAG: hypothetical protein A3I11_04465 [Elusimicrobia bacterium RIFCSPLOWO2_02_FULL_39_32]|nr:MAG: hypothetical protein A3B80_03035 [Elusimicrobia bacterium RIFCSPHIGHO2_02_FULL_39_36]OGR92950.1 MAG: hypothetical protein A3I11_04465 [Elusimicrobia bacterium RIFCSPLOWO2_02_FULL_39_32]OGR99733.1 MAG: hypothetical protein A3G85_01825 [Elusimicrobia bacterium RIFCSPLOWO2_12_FULL_39_28]
MKKNKKIPLVNYDPKVDILYIATKGGAEEEFVEVAPGVQVELDRKKQVIGIEILNASRFLKPILKPLEQKVQLVR